MPNLVREAGHLVRLIVVLAVAIVVFLLVRQAVIPKAFGQLGHYRPGALDDIKKHPPKFAGQQECVLCHEDQAKARQAGRHAKISCEACHGPLAAHAAEPSAKPQLPQATALCKSCHEKDAAKPKWFPQVNSGDHNTGIDCNSCHQAHQPKV